MLKTQYIEDDLQEIGIDEAGRGCLWGPLVAGAVMWPPPESWTDPHKDVMKLIKDSKKISPKKREKIYDLICSLALSWGVGVVDACDIDKRGATWANQTAFRRALDDIKAKQSKVKPYRVLIDGVLPLSLIKEGETQITIVDGDAEYLSIAAASIIAKVYHDRWLEKWCVANKDTAEKYDLLSCKGYGTAKHRSGILEHGYTELHRKLYLRKLIPDIVVERYLFEDEETEVLSF